MEEEEKSPKPGGEPKCIKGAAAGAGRQGRGGRAGGGSSREVWGAERRGGPTGGERSATAPTPARTRALTHTLTLSSALRTSGQQRQEAPAKRNQCSGGAAVPERRGRARQARKGHRRAPRLLPRSRAPAGPPDRRGGVGAAGRGRAPSPLRSGLAVSSPAALLSPPCARRVLFRVGAAVFSPPRPPR